MATPDEKIILTIMEQEGGQCKEVTIRKKVGLRLDYLRSVLQSMGLRDLIDYFKDGTCRIADKGWLALGKSPQFGTGGEWWAENSRRVMDGTSKPGGNWWVEYNDEKSQKDGKAKKKVSRDFYADYVQEMREKEEKERKEA